MSAEGEAETGDNTDCEWWVEGMPSEWFRDGWTADDGTEYDPCWQGDGEPEGEPETGGEAWQPVNWLFAEHNYGTTCGPDSHSC